MFILQKTFYFYKMGTCLMGFRYNFVFLYCKTENDLGADHLIPGGGYVFCERKRLFSKFWKINSLFSYLWEKNSLFMK